ncbi:PWWP domain-containing protein 2 [Cardamine amara subsp. amara]|uniref:PWWP domain-containing protein 2 n=1 Tax=Cardamine amara subsp. amara TaxID=228776 RepID=A0ABD0ZIR3_CARAN
MSTESERAQSSYEAVVGSRIEVGLGNDEMSETLADPLSGQGQELEYEQQGCVTVSGSLASASDHAMEKTESVNEELDLGIGTRSVDVETNESDKKVLVDSQEVVTAKCETEPLVNKEEVEPDMVSSHGTNLSDVKGSDLGVDSKPVSSGKQGAIVDNLEEECLGGLKPYESSLDDDDNAPVTAKVKLSDSDLVWAKVRSHPWWPAQVFDGSAATDKANKYFKKGSFLVTYFGDCTFAWNDASRIKPFRQNFSQMAKQSTLPDFLDAIDFALEEVSRRIQFGLACSCISEDVYQKIKTQNIVNPGIREDSSTIHGGDKVSSAVFFEPANLVDYVKRLAYSPNYDAKDELQFVSKRAQLLAFSRWKGYTDLPEFETLQGSVESAPKTSLAEEKSSLLEVKVSDPEPKKSKQVYTKRRKIEGQDDCKQDGVFEYEDTTVPKKKEKTLAEFIAEKRLSRRNEKISQENPVIEPHCEKKRKVLHSKLPKSTKKIKANLQTEDSGSSPISPKNDRKNNLSAGDKITPEKTRKSFGIGASILRVANQMHSSTPTRVGPCSNSTSKMAAKINGSGKSLQEKPKAEALSEKKISPSPDETLSIPQSASATKTPNGKPIDHLQSGEVEQVIMEARSTNLVEDSMLESRDLKDSSKEQQMVHEDRKEAGNIEDEITIKDSNLTGEIIIGSDLKEQPSNKNCSDGSDSCKEDVSAE